MTGLQAKVTNCPVLTAAPPAHCCVTLIAVLALFQLAKETQDSTAAQAAKTMVDSAEMTPIISQSIESLFALMDKNRAEGSADSTKASSSASSASTPTPGSSEP